jgi:hypothetical protein
MMREIATVRIFCEERADCLLLQAVGDRAVSIRSLESIPSNSIMRVRALESVPRLADVLELTHGCDSAFHEVISVLIAEQLKQGEISIPKGVGVRERKSNEKIREMEKANG